MSGRAAVSSQPAPGPAEPSAGSRGTAGRSPRVVSWLAIPGIPEVAAAVPWRELHVARWARERYGLAEPLFATDGRLILADFDAARRFAERINLVRAAEGAAPVTPATVNAIGLIDELLHGIFHRVRSEVDAGLLRQLLTTLDRRFGRQVVDGILRRFVVEFPPLVVARGDRSAEEFAIAALAEEAPREALLEELIVLWVANQNPAVAPLRELFDDAPLATEPSYLEVLALLIELLAAVRLPDGPSLLAALRRPVELAPTSLEDQLRTLLGDAEATRREDLEPRPAWVALPAEEQRLKRGLDHLAEEVPRLPAGDGPPPVPEPDDDAYAVERQRPRAFAADGGWMPRLALLAKNTLVWLDQLSREHGRPIERLDQVPEAELERIARRGFTGLWLIGVWERSPASQAIKQACGNPEAEASAYAVFDYTIAARLGGEPALAELRRRAARWGLRLGSDMVPNHTGIDSRWVREHPEWFIHTATPPYAAYTFDGPDLSGDAQIGLFLEDHYYSRSDAAVVFKRVDRQSGEVSYLYHGNDGTQTPWNDTAQLDYLEPAVREAVIEQIVAVARAFPILRFDAAMTLAKRHHHRLWYPAPGTGGDIPSRAEHGLTDAEFDARMPREFWREVVERVAQEVPDALLLAEAFWLMETYFVRTLGLHRVYNSAFMHAMRGEENGKFRRLLAAAQAFDPAVLGRYVNFMNNPDEKPAAEQFGTGDKAFAAATVLATLPGLPMFGHGQVEGYHEKYGMEYRRAYRDETPDPVHVARHARQVAPLLARRHLFATSEAFLLYDVAPLDSGGGDDVLAYANRSGSESSLVLVHNRQGAVRGWVTSAPDPRLVRDAAERAPLPRVDLVSGLGLDRLEPRAVAVLTDPIGRRDYLAPVSQLVHQGLYVELAPYEARVFLSPESWLDDERLPLRAVAADLRGQGVTDLWSRVAPAEEQGAVAALLELLDPDLLAPWVRPEGREIVAVPVAAAALARQAALAPIRLAGNSDDVVDEARLCRGLERLNAGVDELRAAAWRHDDDHELAALAGELGQPPVAFAALAATLLGVGGGPGARAWLDRLTRPWFSGALRRAMSLSWLDGAERARAERLLRGLLRVRGEEVLQVESASGARWRSRCSVLAAWSTQPEVAAAVGIAPWEGRRYLHREDLAAFLAGWLVADWVDSPLGSAAARTMVRTRRLLLQLSAAGYRAEALAGDLQAGPPAGGAAPEEAGSPAAAADAALQTSAAVAPTGALRMLTWQATDLGRTRLFLEHLFGWRFSEVRPGYLVAEPGAGATIGLTAVAELRPGGSFVPHLAVADLDALLARAQSLGAGVLAATGEVAGVGRYADLVDPDGGRFSVSEISATGDGPAADGDAAEQGGQRLAPRAAGA